MQEPWLLHDFAEDFYGEDLRLVIVGYIRSEVLSYTIAFCNFLAPCSFQTSSSSLFHAKLGCGM